MVLWVQSDRKEKEGYFTIFKFRLEDSIEETLNKLKYAKFRTATVKMDKKRGAIFFTVTDTAEKLHKDWGVNTKKVRYTECYWNDDCLMFCDKQGGHFCVVDATKGVVRRGFNYLNFGVPLDFKIFNRGIVNSYNQIVLDDEAKDYWNNSVEEDLESFGTSPESIRLAKENIWNNEGFLFNEEFYDADKVKEYKKVIRGYKVRY